MSYLLTKTVAAPISPVTLAEAKEHLRVDGSFEDAYITGLVSAATYMAEAYTERQFITATYALVMNEFPGNACPVYMPRTPLVAVSSITYTDSSGNAQTLSTSVYDTLSDDTIARVVLKLDQSWPDTQSGVYGGVTITFTAGYGTATTDAPASARSAILMIVGHLFENRESVVVGTIATPIPMGATALLDSISARTPS